MRVTNYIYDTINPATTVFPNGLLPFRNRKWIRPALVRRQRFIRERLQKSHNSAAVFFGEL